MAGEMRTFWISEERRKIFDGFIPRLFICGVGISEKKNDLWYEATC